MPIDVIRLDDGKGLLLKCHGNLVPSDKIHLNEALLKSPDELRGLRYMVIYEEPPGLGLSAYDTRRIAEQDKRIAKIIGQKLVVAIVTPRDLNFGMARMWQVFAEETGWETRVFRSMADAARWLNSILGEHLGAELPIRKSKRVDRQASP